MAEQARPAALDPFTGNAARRWLLIGVGTGAVLIGKVSGIAVPASFSTLVFVCGVMALIHQVAILAAGSRPDRPRLSYLAAAFDVVFVSILVFFVGSGTLAVLYLPAVVPHFFDRREGLGFAVVAATLVSYPLAALLHAALVSEQSLQVGRLMLETATLGFVVIALRHLARRIVNRVRMAQTAMDRVREGSLGTRLTIQGGDQIGQLEESVNAMLASVRATLEGVRAEVEELAVLASLFAEAAGHMLEASRGVEASASALASGLRDQREVADFGYEQGTDAALESESLRDQAERVEEDAQQLMVAAVTGRNRVARANETLLAIGQDVKRTASTIRETLGFSKHIGNLARAIGRIARQTHVLALNAAIEAAHAGEHGQGFAVVAEQVRTLAAEAGQAARDVARLVDELKVGIETLAGALSSGEERVRGVGDVASEARVALDDLLQGVSQTSELVTRTAQISRSQAERMASLAEKMSELSSMGVRWSTDADSAATAMAAQIAEMGDLSHMSQRLSDLADRLRTSMARYSQTSADTGTGIEGD